MQRYSAGKIGLRLFHRNNFASSAALAEVCDLPMCRSTLLKRWLQLRFDFDLTSIRILDAVRSTRLRLRFDCRRSTSNHITISRRTRITNHRLSQPECYVASDYSAANADRQQRNQRACCEKRTNAAAPKRILSADFEACLRTFTPKYYAHIVE